MAESSLTAKNWRDLIKPRKIDIDTESTGTYGKFVAEPLERGFGTTLGNSLRRVLLSSLQGAAITTVKIEGNGGLVEHEFTTIPEVSEDVTDIVLNLKEVRLRMHTNEVKTIRIEAEGPKEVKAGDLITDDQVEVLNPGHHIATIAEGGKLRMEITCRRGRGYVPATNNKVPGAPIGSIARSSAAQPSMSPASAHRIALAARIEDSRSRSMFSVRTRSATGLRRSGATSSPAAIIVATATSLSITCARGRPHRASRASSAAAAHFNRTASLSWCQRGTSRPSNVFQAFGPCAL